MSEESKKSNVLDGGPGIVSGRLPCGHVSEDGNLLRDFVVGEITGEEEDILAGTGPMVPRLNEVITNCMRSIGDVTEKHKIAGIVDSLAAADRMLLMIAIRRASLGDYYDLKIKCPECERDKRTPVEKKATVDLSDIEVTEMPEPTIREREDEITSGKVIKWHVMNGHDEDWLTRMQKKLPRNRMTLAILCRVDAIDGEEVHRAEKKVKNKQFLNSLKMLKKLGLRERNEIRELFRTHEGTVDTQIEYECPDDRCGANFKGRLDVGQESFFFPAGISDR